MAGSRTRRNALSYYLNVIVTALLGLVFNPILVGLLGPNAFGIFKAVQKYLDFASVADGRASQALKWTVAYKSANASEHELRRDVGAAIAVWIIAMPLILLISAVLVAAVPVLIADLDPVEVQTARMIAIILGANVALMGLLGLPDAVLLGSNLGSRSVNVSTLVLIASNVGMVLAAVNGLGVIGVAAAVVVGALINALITYFVARRSIPWWGVERPSRRDVGVIARFSGWMLGWELTQKLMLATELLLFSMLIGPIGVTDYTFTSYVAQFALSICLLTTSAFTPQLGRALGRGSSIEAAEITRTARELVLVVIAVFGSAILLLNGGFVALWAGPDRYLGDGLNVLIVVAFAQLAMIRGDAQFQDASLKVRTKTIIGMCSALVSIALAVVAYLTVKSPEAMYVGLIIGRLGASVLFPVVVGRLVGRGTYPWRSLVTTMLILSAAVIVARVVQPSTFAQLILCGVLVTAASAGSSLIGMSATTRRKLLSSVPYLRRGRG